MSQRAFHEPGATSPTGMCYGGGIAWKNGGRRRARAAVLLAAAVLVALVALVVVAGTERAGQRAALGEINADTRSVPAAGARRVARPAETTEQFYASQHPVYIRWCAPSCPLFLLPVADAAQRRVRARTVRPAH